jgi:hypothetical protein
MRYWQENRKQFPALECEVVNINNTKNKSNDFKKKVKCQDRTSLKYGCPFRFSSYF